MKSLQCTPLKANASPDGQPRRAGLKVFHCTGEHRASLPEMAPSKASERRGHEGRQHLQSLLPSRTIGRDVRNQGSPRSLGSRTFGRCWHVLVKGIEHGVLMRDVEVIKQSFSHGDGFGNVFDVGLFAQKAATHGCLGMGPLDLNRSHFSKIGPMMVHVCVGQKPLKPKKPDSFELVQRPSLHPGLPTLKLVLRDGDVPVVVNDQLLVSSDAKVEFHPVHVRDGVVKALEGVFRRLSPLPFRLHDFLRQVCSLRLTPEGKTERWNLHRRRA